MTYQESKQEAFKLMEQGRLQSARELFERLLKIFPENSAEIYYNFAVLYIQYIGNGIEARRCCMQALEYLHRGNEKFDRDSLITLEAYICEILSILSPAYNESYSWIDRLIELQPGIETHRKTKAALESQEKNGRSWWEIMLSDALARHDPFKGRKDNGQFAEALAILQVILENRRQLRIPRNDCRFLVTYCAGAAQSAYTKHLQAMSRSDNLVHPLEVKLILDITLPFVQDYVSKNPSDTEVTKILENLDTMVLEGTVPQVAEEPLVPKGTQEDYVSQIESQDSPLRKIIVFFTLVSLGIIAAGFWIIGVTTWSWFISIPMIILGVLLFIICFLVLAGM